MKRIIYYLLVFVTLFALIGSTVALADEGEVTEGETTETVEESVTETEEEANLFTRLYEAFQENKTNVFTIASGIILFAFSFVFRKDVSVSSKAIVDGITKVLSKTDLTEAQQDAIVSGLNEMVDGYNDIKLKTDIVGTQMEDIARSNASLEKKIVETFSVLVSLIDKEILQNATVMDVLSSVYINNGALPKGVRDFVMLKHTENAKLVQEAAVIEHKDEGGVVSE